MSTSSDRSTAIELIYQGLKSLEAPELPASKISIDGDNTSCEVIFKVGETTFVVSSSTLRELDAN